MRWRRYWQRRQRDDESAREIVSYLEIEFEDSSFYAVSVGSVFFQRAALSGGPVTRRVKLDP